SCAALLEWRAGRRMRRGCVHAEPVPSRVRDPRPMIDRPRNPQDETEQPPRRVSGVGRIALRCVVVAFFVFALALLALREIVLPRADAFRGFVAERVSRAIGIPVTIESLSADWPGLRLRLDARGIVLGDPSGADALRLERIEARPGWSSLLRGEPYFERLDL